MTFLLANWGRSSAHANEPLYTLASSVVVGAPREYSYYTTDSQATVAAANYFAPSQSLNVCNDVSVGDRITVYSTVDGSTVSYTVTSVVINPAAISIQAISGVQNAYVTISSAQMLAGIYGTPVQIIPAPGTSRMIIIENADISLVWATTQYQNGGAVQLQYGSTVHAGGTNALATTVAAASINAATANSSQLLLGAAQAWGANTLANLGIYISCATGEFTNGDSSLRVNVLYRVISLI